SPSTRRRRPSSQDSRPITNARSGRPSLPPEGPSLGVEAGAQVSDQRQQAGADVAFQEIGAELERGPAASHHQRLGPVARIERRGHRIDVAAPGPGGEAEPQLPGGAEGPPEPPLRPRPPPRPARRDPPP